MDPKVGEAIQKAADDVSYQSIVSLQNHARSFPSIL